MTSILSNALFSLAGSFAGWFAAPLASSMSEGVRTALLALLGLLVVIFGCLIAFAFVLRKRPHIVERASRDADADADEGEGEGTRSSRPERDGEGDDRSVVRVARLDSKVCPACRREFESRLRFCPFDAIALVPAAKMLERHGAQVTRACPTCERAFQGDLRFCPHDGSDLVESHPLGHGDDDMDEAHDPLFHDPDHHDGGRRESGHAGERDAIKICPRCRGRYGFAATFCGRDGVELVVLN